MVDKKEILDRLDIKAYYSSELPSLKTNSGTGQALCPFHDDHKASLSVNLKTGLFKCFACDRKGSIFDFYMAKHNVDYRSSFNALAKEAGLTTEPTRRIVKTYDYVDGSGNLLFQTVRYEPKDFKQRRPDGKDGWIYNLQGVRLVPYNLPEVLKAKSVITLEGEKDADNLKALGFTATCNPMGAGKWKPDYNEFFKGKKVVIIPDNDDPGKRHAQTVAKNLKDITESVKIVELPGLPEKGDVSNWIAQGHTKEELIKIIKQTPERKEPEEDSLSFLKKGSELLNLECNIEWVVDRLVPKQSITLLHGKGGIGKTWISLILANTVSKNIPFMDLTTQRMPVTFTDFENSLPVLVERVRKIDATDVLFWHSTNEIRPPKLDREDWEQYKRLPIGLLIFDTLRASQSKDENDSKDMAFIMSRLKELRDMGFTILLLHHTPKSNDRTYKGSTAIMDLADHVLSLHKVKRGSLEDIDDEDEGGYYRLGTKEKTRYEPFHIFLDFDPEKGFVIAPDPDEEMLQDIYEILEGTTLNTNQIFETVKNDLDIKGKAKVIRLLKKGEGRYWTSHKAGKAVYYEPIRSVSKSDYIYRETIRPISKNTPESVSQDSNREPTQTLDSSQKSYSPDTPQTDKTNGIDRSHSPEYIYPDQKTDSVIDLEHEELEIIE